MPQSLYQIYLHIIFSTKNRYPWLEDSSIRREMYSYLAKTCHNMHCPSLIVDGYHDHVHLLLRLGKTVLVPTLIGDIKESSSKWVKTKGTRYQNFFWQSGYGCFSVSASHVSAVKNYIESQQTHHQTVTFQDEYRQILVKIHVKYEERYVWD